ncbi:hypothetical protein [Flavobacterium agrisoli]|uniref:Uncharacterized protein n=1 Tax=Flavobacterium agrisoli TaxID=2793066 RepID=A0A934PM60_9FLAO|nr:hypothetical protein [Flavobacterium agrisoli]MBK0369805.1 hypothetical protein [Flavobacterium agrisoli]
MAVPLRNLFNEKSHSEYSKIILSNIPETSLCKHENFFSLVHYHLSSPNKFYDKFTSSLFSNFLDSTIKHSSNRKTLIESIAFNFYDLDQALKALDEINNKDIHEKNISHQEVEAIYEISNLYLYEYLKINDLILMGLIKPIAYYLRKKNNKGVEKLDIFNCVETLVTTKEFDFLSNAYNHTIRNAIAHGSVLFNGKSMIFRDKKKEISLTIKEFIKKFDELIDIVNGIAYAYRKFYLINLFVFEEKNILIPNSIKINELKTKAEHYAWKILYNYDTTVNHKKQCNLYVSTILNSRDFMNLSAYQTAIYLEHLMPNAYDTLFIQIKTKFKMPCWQSFDMNKLRAYINDGVQDIITDGTYFFDQKKFGKKLDHLKSYKNLFSNHLNYGKLIESRYIKFHSKSFYNVIEKHCLVLNKNAIGDIKSFIRNNTKLLLKEATNFKNTKTIFFSKEKQLSTKYIRVLIYLENMRERSFENSSFSDEKLIAILHMNKSKKIQNVLPSFGEKEENRYCSIFWSKNLPTIK